MNKDVIISIKGTQDAGGDSDSIEFITSGKLTRKGGQYFISYNETEDSGYNSTKTTVKLEGNKKITITKDGKYKSQLILEKDIRHLGYYNTDFGDLVMGVNASNIDSKMSDIGGEVRVDYTLEINHALASENSFYIEVKEAQNTNDKPHPIS